MYRCLCHFVISVVYITHFWFSTYPTFYNSTESKSKSSVSASDDDSLKREPSTSFVGKQDACDLKLSFQNVLSTPRCFIVLLLQLFTTVALSHTGCLYVLSCIERACIGEPKL